MVNALTVDVEDYFHAEAFAHVVPREEWSQRESRVVRNTRRLLDLFARHGCRATFFVLGWVAQRHPALVREIAGAGHEVASHGFEHRLIYTQTPREFRGDVQRAKGILEDLLGARVDGYRAPSYSITTASLWALDILIEAGFRYDSSIFPIYHDRYGLPGWRRFPHTIHRPAGRIAEFPPGTVAICGVNLPMAGGGYFRFLPYWVFRWGLRRINGPEGQAAVVVIHPWELDPDQPVIRAGRLTVWRHRFNLHRTLPRLERLLSDFRFAPVYHVLASHAVLPALFEPLPDGWATS